MQVRLLGVDGLEPRRARADGALRHDRAAASAGGRGADEIRRRYGERAVTRARLLGTGLPAPFERDPRNPLDRRARGGPAAPPEPAPPADDRRDTQGDTEVDEIPPDDA